MKRIVCGAVVAALVAGCAAPGGGYQNTGAPAGPQGGGNGGSQVGNAAAGAAVGAVAGCVLAKALGKKCAEGAAVGAALGAAVGWTTYSEKVAPAQTVNTQAQRQGLAVPRNEIRLKDYQVYSTASVVRGGGEPVQVVGDITLYGQSSHVPEVVQSMTLYKADGQKASDTPQVARVDRVDGAGQYRAVGVYKIPRGMEQGQYTVQSVLLLDGREVARRSAMFQVAGTGGSGAAAFIAQR
jgi:hypothetical protein